MARYTINGRRYDTAEMQDLGITTREQHGVKIVGVYLTKRSKRVFVETYSIWDRGDGCVVGGQLHEAGPEEIGYLADKHDSDELFKLLPDDSE